ncbi:prion-inhibition and propagation-domain-containing protein [Aspergillus venezuelensis]
MDIYGTAVTAITQAYQVTVFIQGVISDIKSYDEDRNEVRVKLNTQLLTLRVFQRVFVHPDHGLLLPGKADPFIAQTVSEVLLQMRKTLAEYELVAVKYGLATSEPAEGDGKPEIKDLDEYRDSFLQRIKIKALSLKLKGYDWSLFDKKKLQKLVEAYTGWSANLRDMMQHFSQESIALAMRGDDHERETKVLGLEPVIQRQRMVDAVAPDEFQSLEGEVTILEQRGSSTPGGFQLATWASSGKASKVTVIAEYHEYENELQTGDLDPEDIVKLKAPIRNLAWLLKNSTFNGQRQSAADGSELQPPEIYALECLGYIDQPDEERHIFLYNLPTSHDTEMQALTTLHAFINAEDPQTKRPLKRPSLNDRFRMARCLAVTLLNIHASKWVHKNIWSRGILLFLSTPDGLQSSSSVNTHRLSNNPNPTHQIHAYLSDWGYARTESQYTDMTADFEPEANIYRHPDRQGRPKQKFGRTHDIYALGVVLLEIGLWMTMSRVMGSKIAEAHKTGKLPARKKVAAELIALAMAGLQREMGVGYTQAVVDCLTGAFRDEDPRMALRFRERVVGVLARGLAL